MSEAFPPIRGIFYRSDTRHPSESPDKILENGFTKRNAEYANPVPRRFLEMSFDIIPASAVCFTRDFKAASALPSL
eukprot:CAMPEP_0185733520 /NCGR_PEP_ID=MMETSP1171-20130828/19790_1 /TAXON_ID=374046 /ORGANISM="Helicotheca tamensis, Strain CCMP826" /LENGTH=75 /DNA_ID=CAMNT_0028403279 /DNA_START=42 /DNA_END=269 /DNA_ORIENTATION=+